MADGPLSTGIGPNESESASLLEELKVYHEVIFAQVAAEVADKENQHKIAGEKHTLSQKLAMDTEDELKEAQEYYNWAKAAADLLIESSSPSTSNPPTGRRGNKQESRQVLISKTKETYEESIQELESAKSRHLGALRAQLVSAAILRRASEQLNLAKTHQEQVLFAQTQPLIMQPVEPERVIVPPPPVNIPPVPIKSPYPPVEVNIQIDVDKPWCNPKGIKHQHMWYLRGQRLDIRFDDSIQKSFNQYIGCCFLPVTEFKYKGKVINLNAELGVLRKGNETTLQVTAIATRKPDIA